MKRHDSGRVHALEIPTAAGALLVPSATIAEVVNYGALTAVPYAPPWLLGVCGWRSLAVPVISFEVLLGQRAPQPAANAKLVVFYPLPGRSDWEFFAVLSASEPRPRPVDDGSALAADPAQLPASPFVAAGLHAGERLLAIPDLDALRQAFYP